jgi:hypothetical protein
MIFAVILELYITVGSSEAMDYAVVLTHQTLYLNFLNI